MKLPVLSDHASLCDQCVALCCRYFALSIEKPETKRDFEDLRWYLLHESAIIFVEEGDWYLQINRKCKALLPDNRCAIYENRPEICREYTTDSCDWHGDEYEYEHLFTEPEQIEAFAKDYLARRRKRKTASSHRNSPKEKTARTAKSTSGRKTTPKKRPRKRPGVPIQLLKSA